MNFKAVIFDKDGVIIDTQPYHFQVFTEFCWDFKWDFTVEEYESFIGTTSKEMFTRIKGKYENEYSAEQLSNMFQTRFVDIIASLKNEKPILGVDILIKSLHSNGIKLAVASSATRRKIELVLKMFNLESYFDVIVSGHEVEKSKPYPDIFLKASELLQVSHEECIVIEDSSNGIMASKSAKIRCIGYNNPLGKQDLSKADLIVDDFQELLNGTFEKGNFDGFKVKGA